MMVYGFTITSCLTTWEANSSSDSQEIPNILQKWKAHYCVHCYWFLTCARLIQSTFTYPVSLINSLILSSHLCLDSPSFIFSSHSLTKIVCAFVPSHACCAIFGEQYKSCSSSLCSSLQLPFTSLYTNIPFSTLSYGAFILHFTTIILIIAQHHFLPVCERQSNELSFISIAQWHFVEDETESVQHILKRQ